MITVSILHGPLQETARKKERKRKTGGIRVLRVTVPGQSALNEDVN